MYDSRHRSDYPPERNAHNDDRYSRNDDRYARNDGPRYHDDRYDRYPPRYDQGYDDYRGGGGNGDPRGPPHRGEAPRDMRDDYH